jgi:hypothetical protein
MWIVATTGHFDKWFSQWSARKMRKLEIVFCVLFAMSAGAASSAEPQPQSAPQPQTGSISGTLQLPSKEAPKGAVAELHQAQPGVAKGAETIFYLFADGSIARKLKELAGKGAQSTVSGVVTEKGYQVTAIGRDENSKK